MVGGEHSLKMSALQLSRFGCNDVLMVLRKRVTQLNSLGYSGSVNKLIKNGLKYSDKKITPVVVSFLDPLFLKRLVMLQCFSISGIFRVLLFHSSWQSPAISVLESSLGNPRGSQDLLFFSCFRTLFRSDIVYSRVLTSCACSRLF